jgi:membrane-associated phospholipid phosphatase
MPEMTAVAAMAAAPNDWQTWGLSVIHSLQGAGNPVITAIARIFTLLGEPAAYALMAGALFWCVDERKGFRTGLTLVLSNGVNIALKNALRVPRPFMTDPSVGLIPETGFSTPSGHAQNAAATWPVLLAGRSRGNGETAAAPQELRPATRSAKRTVPRIACAILLPLCIGASRVYLGVHYPSDVFFGWALGALFAVSALWIVPALYRALNGFAPYRAAADSFTAYMEASGRTARTFKLAAAALAALILNSVAAGDSSMGGMLFGFSAGYILLTDAKDKPFRAASGGLLQKAARLLAGIAGMAAILIVLKRILPGEESQWYVLCRFIRYGLAGFWTAWMAPKLFMAAKLA